MDAAGNSFHNITEFTSSDKGDDLIRKSLLILDKNGNFNGRVQINSCRNQASLYPFRDDMYLTTDYNCSQNVVHPEKDSRVFDHKGNLVLTGDPFFLNRFAAVKTEEGYTVFSQKMFRATPPLLEIRRIDWDFNIEDQRLDLTELLLPKLPLMAHISVLPVETKAGNWVITMAYGTESDSRIDLSPNDNFLILTDGKSIIRRFQFERPNEMVQAIQGIGNEIAVLTNMGINGGKGKKKLYLLDEQLQLKKSLIIDAMGNFDAMLVTQNNIILLHTHYYWQNKPGQRYILHLFDREGNLIKQRELSSDRVITHRLMPFGEKSILLAGSIVQSETVSCAMVWKLDLETPTATEPPQKSPKATSNVAATTPISNMTVDALSQEAMSVAVFPNPASIYINFELKNREDTNPKFLLKVTDMTGKQMHQASFQSVFYELDIAQFPPGTYAYQIINQKDKKDYLTGKFVKIR